MPDPSAVEDVHDTEELITRRANLNKRTVLKLDTILLPFLSILFLLNSLDRANVGSAESAHFTKDTGLPESALNTSLACFFAVFVALQPVGAALGRKYGMARYVPACMTLWGLCTTLHIFVRKEWQLISLRVLIGALEAGFYPTTVSYLSLFYTRYEFAKRLGLFYGQYAVAGALGGILSWAVFSHFPEPPAPAEPGTPPFTQSAAAAQHWHSWQVLFLLEGILTVAIALLGFLWLPHSADTAWFFTKAERQWAEERIRRDRDAPHSHSAHPKDASEATAETDIDAFDESRASVSYTEEGDRLLSSYTRSTPRTRRKSTASAHSLTADSGLSTSDVVSALLDWKIWYLLTCNILSAIPSTAFSVFLPLVIKGLAAHSPSGEMAPALANLLTAPPFLAGAVVLWSFAYWSDKSHQRLTPILWGLGILLLGLTATVMLPASAHIFRYVSLTVLLSGSFVASPLTVAWLTNNIPAPGKRAIVLGVNGWGNLAGVFSALLFAPRFKRDGYAVSFYVTLACVGVAFVGYVGFRALLRRENEWRDGVVRGWDEDEVEREALLGDAPLVRSRGAERWYAQCARLVGLHALPSRTSEQPRRGDERLTFRYGL